jgi:hypothetical protein
MKRLALNAQHRHDRLPLELSLANEPTKADNLRQALIAGVGADDFAIPTFAHLGRELRFERGQFLLDPTETRFQGVCVARHGVIIRIRDSKASDIRRARPPLTPDPSPGGRGESGRRRGQQDRYRRLQQG